MKKKPPTLTVVVIFHDMQREAERTLYSLSSAYQRNVDALSYEVLAIDSGSSSPLSDAAVESFGPDFKHRVFDADVPSPCPALNWGVAQARAPFVLVCIDGARMLSPGILSLCRTAMAMASHPFVYTVGMHLGGKAQNELLARGYGTEAEDALLASIDWRASGYDLFPISGRDPSTLGGFFAPQSESNCFLISTEDYVRLGGFDEGFVSPGGGLANLDLFNRAFEDPVLEPIKLLGEATFHQFHDGVSRPTFRGPTIRGTRWLGNTRRSVGPPTRCAFRSPRTWGATGRNVARNTTPRRPTSRRQAPTARAHGER